MAQCLLGLLGYAKEVGKCVVTEALWPPIKRHIDYWWSFGDNIQGLRDETDNLERETRHMDKKIEEARLRAETLTLEAGDWSKKCTQKLEEARRTLQSGNELKPSDIFSRYLMGKSAKETTEGIAKLRTEGNLIIVSDPTPPPAMGPIRHEPTMEFRSRGHIEKDVIESLNDDHVRMIAICGPGGVGKTTMVQRIEERVRKENLFDEVVHVVVSQQIDMLKIQKEMAELLGLHLNEDTLAARAHKLHTRLVDSKRKLIVFDDVWESFNLRDIGVPLENDFLRCKMILTSRVEDACKKMNAQKIIRMNVLTKDEAWSLFKEKAGSYVEDSDLRVIAEDVVKECKGLPLALVIVGEALKDQTVPVWRDSLRKLRRSIPTDFLEDLYMPLKLSYDFLENASVRDFFLIFCLFPEDYDIPIETVTLYSIGLGMFEEIGDIEEGRSTSYSFVEKLKSRFLLMDGYSTNNVKMHDVVRDVAIFIGSKEKHGFLKSMEVSTIRSSSKDSSLNCNWMSIDMSSIENAKLPVGSDFPNLRLLIIQGSYSSSLVFDAEVICLEGMGELSVLAFLKINISSLPLSLGSLKKLTTLNLVGSTVEDISIVGELTSLEILCIRGCHNIQVLSADIGRLNRLRFLELFYCLSLKRVVAGVISNLVKLEELKIINSFDKWEAKGNKSEEGNASLSELESLPNLSCLEIDISDQDLVSQEICLSPRLVRYSIYFQEDMFDEMRYERRMRLKLPGDPTIAVGNWIHQLVRTIQSLKLDGDGSNKLNLPGIIEYLRYLDIENCSTMKKLGNAIDCKFHVLEQLKLTNLRDFEEIIDGTIPEESKTFGNLEGLRVGRLPKLGHLWKSVNQDVLLEKLNSIRIDDCPNLRYLFSVATAMSLVQLQQLEIESCDTLEDVFLNDIEQRHIIFPKLKTLKLIDLPCLTTFCRGIESIRFPKLTRMWIKNLPRMRNNSLLPLDQSSHDHHSLHFFCNPKVEIPRLEELDINNLEDAISKIWCPLVPHHFFSNLTHLWISDVNGIRNLMSSSIALNLVNLDYLGINDCQEMLEVIEDDQDVFLNDIEQRHIIFPELETLELIDLPCLTTFCRGVESIRFPELRMMVIKNLPRMRNNSLLLLDQSSHDHHSLHFFCNPKVEIPRLEVLHIRNLEDAISKIWCPLVPHHFFSNLTELRISGVNGIRNLMSSSIALNLVNLDWLDIKDCQEMLEVIEDDQEIYVTSLFPKLQHVEITRLQKLRSFCQWKHAFELPSLNIVHIDDCPAMEAFSFGSPTSPNLSYFSINSNQVETKDLNEGIHDHFMNKVCSHTILQIKK